MITIGNLQIAIWLIVLVVIVAVAIIIFVVNLSVKAHRLGIGAGSEELIGKTAEVKKALEPRGMVFVDGEQWSAILDEGQAEPGEEVTITKVDGLKLYVTKKG